MRKVKKFCLPMALLLVLGILVASFTGCGHVGTEEEVLTAATDLFQKAERLTKIYFGTGIDYDRNESKWEGAYAPATEEGLQELQVQSLAKLRTETEQVFSLALVKQLDDTVFASVSGLTYTRYYESGAGTLMVFREYNGFANGDNRYDLGSLKVVSIGRNEATVALDITAINGVDQKEYTQVALRMVYESDAWRIDSMPCVAFDPEA